MKCAICKREGTQPGTATVTLEPNRTTLVFKRVPASVCTNCAEEYLDEETTTRLLETAEKAAGAGVQVHIGEYVAA